MVSYRLTWLQKIGTFSLYPWMFFIFIFLSLMLFGKLFDSFQSLQRFEQILGLLKLLTLDLVIILSSYSFRLWILAGKYNDRFLFISITWSNSNYFTMPDTFRKLVLVNSVFLMWSLFPKFDMNLIFKCSIICKLVWWTLTVPGYQKEHE